MDTATWPSEPAMRTTGREMGYSETMYCNPSPHPAPHHLAQPLTRVVRLHFLDEWRDQLGGLLLVAPAEELLLCLFALQSVVVHL